MTSSLLPSANSYIADGYANRAIDLLNTHVSEHEQQMAYWKVLGFAYHEEQLEAEATAAFKRATELAPDDAELAILLGQSQFYSGLSATDAFAAARQLDPSNLNAIRGYAMAIAAEGDTKGASELLQQSLAATPTWLEGHKLLATIRHVNGDSVHFADSYQRACQKEPSNLALRLEWFRCVAQQKNWALAKSIIADAEKRFGRLPQLKLARLFIASETKDDELAIDLFEQTQDVDDVIRDMALVRSCIRRGQLEKAQQVAMQRVAKSSARVFIPYLDIIWRLQGSDYCKWLNGEDGYVKTFDLNLTQDELQQLSQCLDKLHTAKNPFAQQSVRGGTQTDQNLFLRHESILKKLRQRVACIVADYVKQLPAAEPTHPLLGIPRTDATQERIQFSGSWSVKLNAQGHNVSHNHPLGWISSALYVSIPSESDMGKEPAGHLQFGAVPQELELTLKPFKSIQPQVGKIVLFPSTLWHATVPFYEGERLAIAFDIKPARH